ncbi:PrgI family protein [Candidatus Gracilibacteria bacterium]|nr:PrgI family protein [Candidatus Gracilibacteria bacterium]
MQYKIPVQIENEDPIFLGLSLRQLMILMIGFSFAYLIFTSLEPNIGPEIALIPSGIVAIIALLIAIFKQYEMTFVPFVLALILLNSFSRERRWEQGVDSFQPIDVGFLVTTEAKKKDSIDLREKMDTMQELQEKLKKI